MASKLSVVPITDIPLSGRQFPRPPERIPHFSLLSLHSFSEYRCSRLKSSSRRRLSSTVCSAVKEELIQSPSSDSTQDPKTSTPSSKLVLVVGGSGGV
ncbi:unnamed protein product, partial [Ilex paraguariensis]